MKKFIGRGCATLALALLPLAPAAAMTSAFNDWVIVPTVRVGPIGKYTSVQALRSILPNALLRHSADHNGPKTAITYRKTNRQHNVPDMIIRWHKNRRVIKQVTIFHFAGPWRTVMGIRLNTSLDSLHQVNGARIPLRWRRNFLHAKAFNGGKISRHYEFAFRQPAGTQTDLRQPMPPVLHSDHPRVRGKNFRVIGIVVIFP